MENLLLVWYNNVLENAGHFLSAIYEYRISVPIAVISAISIFITKEFLEWRRKKRSDERKLKAIYLLVTLELEENFSAIRMFGDCLSTVKMYYQEDERADLSVVTLPSKTKSINLTVNGYLVSGSRIPEVQSEVFKKKLEDIAQLDGKNFPEALDALENLKELEHIVQSLVDYIGTKNSIWLDGFTDYANQILDASCYFLRRYYELIGGKEEDKPLRDINNKKLPLVKNEISTRETAYDGHRFRTQAEARWAVFFNTVGWRYEYKKQGYDLQGTWYLPDFFIPEIGYWLEVIGTEPTEDEVTLCTHLVEATGHPCLLAEGPPLAREQLRLFAVKDGSEFFEGQQLYFADDRRNNGEFWLNSDNGGFSIGPVDGPNHDRDPGIFSATKEAYEAALSARFEHGEKLGHL